MKKNTIGSLILVLAFTHFGVCAKQKKEKGIPEWVAPEI